MAVSMIVLALTFTFASLFPSVSAANVAITSISLSHGKVGDLVRIVGTINKTDGTYRIWFANSIVNETTAVGTSVNATFHVPMTPQGNYNVTLQDLDNNLNATTQFTVEPAYDIKVLTTLESPKQLQENSTITIRVNVTGGTRNTIYYANVTVKPPTPRNETYWQRVPLSNTTNTGSGSTILVYPNGFSGTPNTNYVGTYTVSFNKTATTALDTDTFTIGLTNATEYHRRQFVNIKAYGYHANESVTIKVTSSGKIIGTISSVNATQEGLVLTDWGPIPANASIGTYTLNITSNLSPPSATKKTPQDVQSFTIPGFTVKVTTQNLAQETVQSVAVKIFENGKSLVNATSNSSGSATVKLDIGNYTFQAFYKGGKVYEHILEITNTTSYILDCNLTNLKISVSAFKDAIKIAVPEAQIYLTRENKTLTTNINGTVIAHSLLPNVSYTLNASRYGALFNTTTLSTLLVNGTPIGWFNVTFICPIRTLQVNTTDANGVSINNVKVSVQELIGGLFYEGNTSAEGIAGFSCVFGKYNITVYDDKGMKLNETTINLFQNQNVTLRCKLYDLTISIKLADYFGQPISNVKIILLRGDSEISSQLTQSDGIAEFGHVTGGTLQASVYLFDQAQPYMSQVFYAGNSTTVGIKLGEFVLLAGFFVEMSYFATAIIIVASVIVVLSIEVYRRRHSKPALSQS
jgi:hypothetical protein